MDIIDISDKERVYFVGDLHGDWKALHYFLNAVKFSEKDIIISVGDLIDRGDYNLEVVNFFLFSENALAVRGNHEDMAIQGLLYGERNQAASWIANGGAWILDYPMEMIQGLVRQLENTMPIALTLKHNNTLFGVTHAECPTEHWEDYALRAGNYFPDDNKAIWGRDAIKGTRFTNIRGVDYTIHGHSVRSGVTHIGNQMWIDTGSVFDTGSEKYGLTIMEWGKNRWTNHRVRINPYEPKGREHLIL